MKKDKNIPTELEALSPLLSKMKKEGVEDGFQVPFNFFEELPDLVLAQTKTERETVVKKPSPTWWDDLKNTFAVLFQPRYAIGFATISLLVIASLYLLPNPSAPITTSIALEEISSAEIDAYISKHLEEFQEEIFEQEELVDVFENDENLNIDDAELEEYFDEMIDDLELENLL